MNAHRRSTHRLLVILSVIGAVIVIGTAAASGQGAPTSGPPMGDGASGSTGVGVSSTGVAVSGTAIAAPAWCCGATGAVPGLTVVGQATMDGQDTAARDATIVNAVLDATDQAQAAADAAGIQLGPIVDMQVSSMPMVYPMMGGATGTSPGSAGGDPMEPAPYLGSVSVTITWSLG